MANSIDPLEVTTTKKNIFAETNAVGTKSYWMQNIGSVVIYFGEKSTEPTTELGGKINPNEQMYFGASSGIWVWTERSNSLITIQEV